jgi:hypothetical protein
MSKSTLSGIKHDATFVNIHQQLSWDIKYSMWRRECPPLLPLEGIAANVDMAQLLLCKSNHSKTSGDEIGIRDLNVSSKALEKSTTMRQ